MGFVWGVRDSRTNGLRYVWDLRIRVGPRFTVHRSTVVTSYKALISLTTVPI